MKEAFSRHAAALDEGNVSSTSDHLIAIKCHGCENAARLYTKKMQLARDA